ncbi:hypothetical protein FA592_06930 [Sulfurospirillum diekertiae]|uniref:Uncharacterized protein n=1 Tax=Sulfurospirillum diekertiae TaxID=1854492 RepID=A0A6G9VSP2_9BACT|nr:hypothetical protein [Sulfurospirillum diekertiae]QIR75979.1 hypothetical protein FA584_07050 [Sulfurospirillum diekertiae]QIR78623.1 hypothetical protein FA592_06930 [Sulfurospirillum diekertiae]
MASVGAIGNVIYANQMVTVQAAKQMDYQNSVQMQSMIAEAMQNEKEEIVEDVRPAEETYKIDPENEHERQKNEEENGATEEQMKQQEEMKEHSKAEEEEVPAVHDGHLDVKA